MTVENGFLASIISTTEKNASSLYFRESEDFIGQTEAVKLSIFPIVPSVSYNFKF